MTYMPSRNKYSQLRCFTTSKDYYLSKKIIRFFLISPHHDPIIETGACLIKYINVCTTLEIF